MRKAKDIFTELTEYQLDVNNGRLRHALDRDRRKGHEKQLRMKGRARDRQAIVQIFE